MNGADTKSVYYTLGVLESVIFGIRLTLPLTGIGVEYTPFQQKMLDLIRDDLSRAEAQIEVYKQGVKEKEEKYSQITQ